MNKEDKKPVKQELPDQETTPNNEKESNLSEFDKKLKKALEYNPKKKEDRKSN